MTDPTTEPATPPKFFASETRSIKPGNRHGGARPGAGRPPLTLRELVEQQRFNWLNCRHRDVLEFGDVPDDLSADIERVVTAYRRVARTGARGPTFSLAKQLQRMLESR